MVPHVEPGESRLRAIADRGIRVAANELARIRDKYPELADASVSVKEAGVGSTETSPAERRTGAFLVDLSFPGIAPFLRVLVRPDNPTLVIARGAYYRECSSYLELVRKIPEAGAALMAQKDLPWILHRRPSKNW